MSNHTQIAVIGAAGRMGGALIRCADRFDALRVTAALERPGHDAVGTDAGLHAGRGELGVPIADDPGVLRDADVCIDFSFHASVPDHLRQAASLGKAFVLGATGLSDAESGEVAQAAETVPVVWAPNRSLCMNLLFALVEQAARALGTEYDAEIVEMHHRHKHDAPSGTALHLARRLAAARDQDPDAVACHGRHGEVGERPRGEIGIHALRGGDVVGEHTVSLAADGERIELAHRASSRENFAFGALKAARWVHGREAGLYDMQDVLGL